MDRSAPGAGGRGARRWEPAERLIRRTHRAFVGSYLALAALAVARVVSTGRLEPVDAIGLVLLAAGGVAALAHRRAVAAVEAGRRAEAEGIARILRGLSRSLSPDAVVGAMVEELADVTGADHVAIVRRRPDAPVLEATLVTARSRVPPARTLLPIAELEDPDPEGRRIVTRPLVAVPMAIEEATPARAEALVAVGVPASADGGVALGAADPNGAGGPTLGRDDRTFGLPAAARGRSGLDRIDPADRTSGLRAALDLLRSAFAPAGGALANEPWAGVVRPGGDERPELGAADRIAGRLAHAVGRAFGLSNTLAAPLEVDGSVAGAIVLSRRAGSPWPSSAQRLLASAAIEASAALSRAYTYRAAEARASTDALTGLPNRRYFDEYCSLLAQRRRADDALGVLMIDVDRFKSLNDRFGHAAGDEVLRAVGRAIAGAVRDGDVPARVGGEEFAVILRNPNPAVAAEIGERVRRAVRSLDLRALGIDRVSVSVGVAVSRGPDEPAADVVARADRALYRAKRSGRDRVVLA